MLFDRLLLKKREQISKKNPDMDPSAILGLNGAELKAGLSRQG